MSAVRDDARPVIDPPLGCFFGVHAATREPGEDFARCACNRPDDTGRVPRPYAGSDVRCGTCAAAGVFRWQDTCEAIGHDARAESCPGCGTSPAYRRRLPDPWDTHDVCPGCGFCYTHGGQS